MKAFGHSKVLLLGCNALGAEIAKNVLLVGVKELALVDDRLVTENELNLVFFFSPNDIGKPRSEALAKGVEGRLKPKVAVRVLKEKELDSALGKFDTVVATGSHLPRLTSVNRLCRLANVKFICAEVHGLMGYLFNDLGPNFEVKDSDGEEPQEFECTIQSENGSLIGWRGNLEPHNLTTGDVLLFKNVTDMKQLNGKQVPIQVLDELEFKLKTDLKCEGQNLSGGTYFQLKKPTMLHFERLEAQLELRSPPMLDGPLTSQESVQCFELIRALLKLSKKLGGICQSAVNHKQGFLKILTDSSSQMVPSDVADRFLRTAEGCFAPFLSIFGGMVAQEIIKSVTGVGTPVRQWFFHSRLDLASDEACHDPPHLSDPLRMCVGPKLAHCLADSRLFLVGCGAIGCELLKNMALLDIGTGAKGDVIVTDDDVIEMSNLSRQFLFTEEHVGKKKSEIGCEEVSRIRKRMKLEPMTDRVGPETRHIFKPIFQTCDLVTNALDNVEARQFVDECCVEERVGLIDSGTLGLKGHIQVIVPHLTESYGSTRDVEIEDQVAMCTLRHFPTKINHCVEWAKNLFVATFDNEPKQYNDFWKSFGTPAQFLQSQCVSREGSPNVGVKLLVERPSDMKDCIRMAKGLYLRYFVLEPQQLLRSFPVNAVDSRGERFWAPPKRAPRPLDAEQLSDFAIRFIDSCSELISRIYVVREDHSVNVAEYAKTCPVLDYDDGQELNLDEDGEPIDMSSEMSEQELAVQKLSEYLQTDGITAGLNQVPKLAPESFEKDTKLHVQFVWAASSLRAMLYSLEPTDQSTAKRIAGSIIPAIATTTAVVAGFVSTEIVAYFKEKMVLDEGRKMRDISKFTNTTLNLALPYIISSSPGPFPLLKIAGNLRMGLWDRLEVEGDSRFTIQNLIEYFLDKDKNGVNLALRVECLSSKDGRSIFYFDCPGFKNDTSKTMAGRFNLLKKGDYIDMLVSFVDGVQDSEENQPITIRFTLTEHTVPHLSVQ